jgi:hypothetical protein
MEAVTMMKTMNIKVKGCGAVTIETDCKKWDSLDQFVTALIFTYYRKENPDRIKHILDMLNAHYEAYEQLKQIKVEIDKTLKAGPQ